MNWNARLRRLRLGRLTQMVNRLPIRFGTDGHLSHPIREAFVCGVFHWRGTMRLAFGR
jgi:hypothetical protein